MTNDLLARIDAALIALPADVYDLLRECRERIKALERAVSPKCLQCGKTREEWNKDKEDRDIRATPFRLGPEA